MKKNSILIIFSLFFLIFPEAKEQIELRDGTKFTDEIISCENGIFILKEKGKIEADKVKVVRVIELADKPAVTEKPAIITKDIEDILKKAEEAVKKYPNSNGIILLDEGTNVLNEDGTSKYSYHFIGKILSVKTKEWSKISLFFEDERDRVNILLARTITPEGKVYELDKSTINISSPSREMAFFGGGKIMSATIPAVEIGSIVEFVYEEEVFNPWDKNVFDSRFYFQSEYPLILSKSTVTIPSSKQLNYFCKNMPASSKEPVLLKKNNRISYTWKMENMEPVIKEPLMSDLSDIMPGVFCCLFKDREYLYNWASKILLERMTLTPELEKQALEITKEGSTIEEKIALLYYFVQNKIRYISIKGSVSSGWGGHPATETCKNKYGDCIDKSVLFATMLKVIGVNAYPVTLRTNNKGTAITEIPVLDSNHAIVEVHLNDKVFYLDPVARNYRYPYFCAMDHGVKVVNEITKKINVIEVPPPEHNMNSYITEINIQDNGDSFISTKCSYTGEYEAGLRSYWENIPSNIRFDKFQEYINYLSPGGTLKTFEFENLHEISKPLELIYDYVLPNYPVLAGSLMIFGIPTLEYRSSEIALEERKYNIEYPTSKETSHNVKISIPNGYKIKYLPKKVSLKCNNYAAYEASYDVQDNYIIFKDDFKIFQRVIPPVDYKIYKEFLQNVVRFSKEKIFFIKE